MKTRERYKDTIYAIPDRITTYKLKQIINITSTYSGISV